MSWIGLTQIIYPVGSVYISLSATSPASIVGGVWSPIIGVLRGSSTTDSVGINVGSDTHTLTINEIPSHCHTGNAIGFQNPSTDENISYVVFRPETNTDQWPAHSPTKTSFVGGGKHTALSKTLSMFIFGEKLLRFSKGCD